MREMRDEVLLKGRGVGMCEDFVIVLKALCLYVAVMAGEEDLSWGPGLGVG